MDKINKAYVVTHTHWDREWRYPLWENRMYLVNLMEELLDILDTNPNYKSFLLDGQTVVIEDYLQVRPENREKIEKYIKEGKLQVGPWYTLPDLYPLDGEWLVRNLLKGTRCAKSLGKCLNVAYESFGWGQISQFPQIYKNFGLDVAIVAKNVSKERAPESEFLWEGADGTRILSTRLGQHGRANFFMNSYLKIMNGVDFLSDDYKLGVENAGVMYHQADEKNFYQDYLKLTSTEKYNPEFLKEAVEIAMKATEETTVKSHRVIMNGSDSTTAQPMLTEIIKKANEVFEDTEFILSTMEEYTDKLKELVDYDRLKIVKGELRDGPSNSCSANALMTRPNIKMLNKKLHNALVKYAEPLSVTSHMLGKKYDSNFLDIAIKYIMLSHPHDSINGVTQDKTVDDVMYMLNQALEISEVITNTVCAEIIKKIDTSSFDLQDIVLIAVNPSPVKRNEVVKVYIDTPQDMNIWDFDIIDSMGKNIDKQLISRKEEIVPVNDLHARPWPFYIDRHCVYMNAEDIPAGGYKVLKVVPKKNFNRKAVFWPDTRISRGEGIGKASNILENENLKVTVQNNGTINILDKNNNKIYNNLNYFEDTGDCGDYWIYYPPYHNKTYSSEGCNARIWLEDNGLLSATIASEVKMTLPAYAFRHENGVKGESKRSDEEKVVSMTSYYTLKKNSKKVDVRLKVDNTIEDHRLRVMFDTGIKTKYIDAAGHFTVDRRPVTPALDRNGEYYPEMETLPQQTFVDVSNGENGLAVVNNCLIEYQVIDNEKSTLALTLLRGVRNIICTEMRSAGAFPQQKGGQSLGILEYEYSIYPHEGNWESAAVYSEAESLNVPIKLIQTSRNEGGELPLECSFFSIDNEALVLSTFKKAEDSDAFILRVFNPSERTIEGRVNIYASIKEAHLVNLNEERLEALVVENNHTVKIIAEPNKIVTIEMVF
ncbi:glycosyl hydrolase-related protein [Clostridium estertheticum]|uniref:alpha-mannosidase n=1 Tax=Clostridium estertheticum TaxID=238834 RepID=UPI0013E985F0|nr:glycoside hydrolase family 38 C-terminal domain-containing protein [Clostridium estertheticum]MBZ9686024.1 glycosyl hydrolase-related protein [Clostridium estertheticum]